MQKYVIRFLIVLAIAFMVTGFFVYGVMALESSAPVISNISPTEGAIVSNSSVTLKFDATDPDNVSNAVSDYYIKVNGNIISANFTYEGSWVDGYGGSYYQINTRTVAHLSGQVARLKDGPQTVEVMSKDQKGNMVVKSWTFTVAVPPAFSGMTPAPGTTTNNRTTISVNITDNDTVNPDSIMLMLDGLPVQHSFNPAGGLISYTAQVPLLDGTHTVWVTAADMSGNKSTKSWTYKVGEIVQLTFLDNGKVLNTSKPAITVSVTSPVKLSETGNVITIDGQTQQTGFAYTGHWNYSSWVVDDYKSGNLTCSPVLSEEIIPSL
jgi:hypothetical protein